MHPPALITETTAAAILQAVLGARPDLAPTRVVELARNLNLVLLSRREARPRPVARLVLTALHDDVGGVGCWSAGMLVMRFILSWRFERLPDWAREALTDWQFGRVPGVPAGRGRHPWMLASAAIRRRALAVEAKRRDRGGQHAG